MIHATILSGLRIFATRSERGFSIVSPIAKGNEGSKPYAAYELNQLRETFADLAEILPKYRDLSIPDMITSTVKEPLAALKRAIMAKDGNQFTAAYGQLTAACNACHQSYDRAVIVIQAPTGSTFPDQDFRSPTK
jgi:hypothetical protein